MINRRGILSGVIPSGGAFCLAKQSGLKVVARGFGVRIRQRAPLKKRIALLTMALECLAIDSVFADLVLDLPLGNAKLLCRPALVAARVPECVFYNVMLERRQYLV
jgi:hypothetical protein